MTSVKLRDVKLREVKLKSYMRRLTVSLITTVVAMGLSHTSLAQLGFDIARYKSGHVVARAVVKSESGNPVFVEYDTQGNEIKEYGEASGELHEAWVMSAGQYEQVVRGYQDVQHRGRNSFSRGARIVSKQEYLGLTSSFTTRDGKPLQNVPTLEDNTHFVYIRHRDQILIPDISPVLYESPIDLRQVQDIDERINALLINRSGRVLHASENNIGYRVAFFRNSDEDPILRAAEHERVFQGIPNVPVSSATGFVSGHGVTDEHGAFTTSYLIPPCPGFFTEYTVYNFATLRYRKFDPRAKQHGIFTLKSDSYDSCNGVGATLAASGSLIGLMTYVNLVADQATRATYNQALNFFVDSAVIAGEGEFSNPAALSENIASTQKQVEIADRTAFEYRAPTENFIAQKNYDFDGDGIADRSVLGKWKFTILPSSSVAEKRFEANSNGPLQGIYFSSTASNPDLPLADPLSVPDLVKLADKKEDFRHQGLLESISVSDLQDTDLFVFRESNGMLITHRRGLREEELHSGRDAGVDEANSQIFYQFLIRGPKSRVNTRKNFSSFQSDAKMNEALHARAADHLRAHEPIKIVAINRKTGYIGTVKANYMDTQVAGLISFPIEKLILRPPNLKVFVERKHRIEKGATQCNGPQCEQDYIIGFEGAATTNDTIITISTEWYDIDGSPLPEGLHEFGYTGRLAKITGANSLSTDGGQLAHFGVIPGRQIQTIRLKGDYTSSEHFYVQINPEPENRNPDFSTLGAAEDGPLKYRPKYYVPFLVPIEDQNASIRQRNAFKRSHSGQGIGSGSDELDPVFKWFFRPEMQFSLYDLELKEIQKKTSDSVAAIDIYQDDIPRVNSEDDYLRLAYNLVEQLYKPLPYLSRGSELVFAFGEEEIKAKLDSNSNIIFANLEHFALLDSEDFLSIRLFNNHDPSNILWEFAFDLELVAERVAEADNRCNVVPNRKQNDTGYRTTLLTAYEPENPSKMSLTLDGIVGMEDNIKFKMEVEDDLMDATHVYDREKKEITISFDVKASDEDLYYKVYFYTDENRNNQLDAEEPRRPLRYRNNALKILISAPGAFDEHESEVEEDVIFVANADGSGYELFEYFKSGANSATGRKPLTYEQEEVGTRIDTREEDYLVNAWTHGAGVNLNRVASGENESCHAQVPYYVHPLNSPLATKVRQSAKFTGAIKGIVDFNSFGTSRETAVDCNNGDDCKQFSTSDFDIDINFNAIIPKTDKADLFAAIGAAKFKYDANVRMDDGILVDIYDIKIEGTIYDMYDFNYGKTTLLVDYNSDGAIVQLGYENARQKGGIFVTFVPFEETYSVHCGILACQYYPDLAFSEVGDF